MKNKKRFISGLGLVAALSLAGIAQAQPVTSKLTTKEPRLRATGLFTTTGISHTRVLQPWIPLEIHSPYTNVAPADPSYPDNPFYSPLISSTGLTPASWVAPAATLTNLTAVGAGVTRPLAAFSNTAPYQSVNNLSGPKTGVIIGTSARGLFTFGTYFRYVAGILDSASPALGAGVNSDGDDKRDVDDDCPLDPEKVTPGKCGCGYQETDGDSPCTDPTAAEQTSDGGTTDSQLRVLVLDDGKQYRATGYRVKSALGKNTVRVRLDIALPRFPNADDLLFQSDDQADEVINPTGVIDNTKLREGGGLNIATWFDSNGDRAVDAGEVETYFNSNLAEEADRVAYSCGLQKRANGGDFKLVSNMKELEKNQNAPGGAAAAAVRRYAFPQWTVTTVQDGSEYRFRCIAENKNSGLSAAFTSNPFNLKNVKVK